jgi:heme-degrading monooxygenase HmoA
MAIFVYLWFRMAETADVQDFEGDMRAMAELAKTQPGYVWSEMGRSMQDQLAYVVVSDWEDIEDCSGLGAQRGARQDPAQVGAALQRAPGSLPIHAMGTTDADVDPSSGGRSACPRPAHNLW